MKYALIDLIICPNCRFYPLNLFVFEKQIKYKNNKKILTNIDTSFFCKTYCGLHKHFIKNIKNNNQFNCEICLATDIIWGVILCPKCCSWYPIILGLPLLYPNYLKNNIRIKTLYNLFINKFSTTISKILHNLDKICDFSTASSSQIKNINQHQ